MYAGSRGTLSALRDIAFLNQLEALAQRLDPSEVDV